MGAQEVTASGHQVFSTRPHFIVVMGVCGTGKTTLAIELARRMGWDFQEGDELHPASNVAKMSAGVPLTDEDRFPWLQLCHDWLEHEREIGHGAILTCSALKRSYRERLSAGLPVEFVYVKVSPEVLQQRLTARKGHFMPPTLLPSQLATLEEPGDDEPVIAVNGELAAERVVEQLVDMLAHDMGDAPTSEPAAPDITTSTM